MIRTLFNLVGFKNIHNKNIDQIFITVLDHFINCHLSQIKVKDAIKHPNWNMGKNFSRLAMMMNKVFEVIEAKNIFNLSFNKLKILIHRDSIYMLLLNLIWFVTLSSTRYIYENTYF